MCSPPLAFYCLVTHSIQRSATRSHMKDYRMPSYPFGMSLPQHALLVTDSCEACGTTWKKTGSLNRSICQGNNAMEKQTLNHRKSRDL